VVSGVGQTADACHYAEIGVVLYRAARREDRAVRRWGWGSPGRERTGGTRCSSDGAVPGTGSEGLIIFVTLQWSGDRLVGACVDSVHLVGVPARPSLDLPTLVPEPRISSSRRELVAYVEHTLPRADTSNLVLPGPVPDRLDRIPPGHRRRHNAPGLAGPPPS
jgi:hypothetical protein